MLSKTFLFGLKCCPARRPARPSEALSSSLPYLTVWTQFGHVKFQIAPVGDRGGKKPAKFISEQDWLIITKFELLNVKLSMHCYIYHVHEFLNSVFEGWKLWHGTRYSE